MALIGVIPAAGYASRLQPLPASKEVLPVRGRPVMDHLVERMLDARCDELRVVTRPEKQDVVERAEALGASVVLGRPATVPQSLALGLAGLAPADAVLFGFPDTLWEPVDGFTRLLGALGESAPVALGLFRTPELSRSDVVTVAGDRVTGVHPKPAEPASELVWGCLVARVGALEGVAERAEVGDHLDALARQGLVRAVDFETPFVDVGTPTALAAYAGTGP